MSNSTEGPRENLRGQVQLRQGDIIEISAGSIPTDSFAASVDAAWFSLAIVVSHDCDIDASASKDPLIEFFPLKEIPKLDRSKTHTKNARSLHFEARTSSGDERYFEIEAPNKFAIKKADLWGREFAFPYFVKPDQCIELADWLSARYRRAALPNNFEARYKKVRERFWTLISGVNQDISAVLFLFDDDQNNRECAADEPYTLSIFLIYPEREAPRTFEPLISDINRLFESSYRNNSLGEDAGIEIRRCAAISEYALSMAVYRRAIHHRADWMSYESDPSGPML
jgi:hypothetical protein